MMRESSLVVFSERILEPESSRIEIARRKKEREEGRGILRNGRLQSHKAGENRGSFSNIGG